MQATALAVAKLVQSDPAQALDLCLEKVQQVLRQPATTESVGGAKALVETFLATSVKNNEVNKPLLDLTFSKLEMLHQVYLYRPPDEHRIGYLS